MASAASSLGRNEMHQKAFNRLGQIMAENDGGKDASDAKKAIETDGWEKVWQEGVTPWANVRINAPVQFFQMKSEAFPKSGKVLVGGAGTGEDVVIFAKAGYDAVGVDSSATAVKKGQEVLAAAPKEATDGKMELLDENYFTMAAGEGYDIIYDYTFFVAIPPVIRAAYAEAATRLIKPGGVFAAVVFPIDGDRTDGPPYSVTIDTYNEALGSDWELVLDAVPPTLPPPMIGKVKFAVWKSKKM
ncbi:S-adenosyl-L-methionine-dependent methyltransferase [Clavulina sp. PMI_390]|nr:S-adenosyl-L-methionine-dependent methyltransferase [Clavulina sp. PMI_390]